MTRLISAFIVLLALLGAWGLYRYWDSFQDRKAAQEKAEAAKRLSPEQLPGLPADLQPSLDAATRQGPRALRNWLNAHRHAIRDPRLAWIELDYCTMVARENPSEARRVFALVQQRTTPSSPVWPRVQQLRRSFE